MKKLLTIAGILLAVVFVVAYSQRSNWRQTTIFGIENGGLSPIW